MSGGVSSKATPPAAELDALLHLRLLPGLGDLRLAALLAQHGSASAALAAGTPALGEAAAVARDSRPVLERLRRTRSLVARLGLEVLVRGRPGYPAVLEHLHDPPALLFARGEPAFLERPAVAIVGSRRSTAYGDDVARMLGRDLARAGVVVVSGLARGIDAAAHQGALPTTIAVLGCGIDVTYPRTNARLQERIAAEGLLLSEFMPGEPALRHNFPRRNRIIAALARGVVVVEAAAGSGSLITVEHAVSIGRDVLAVPGPVGRSTSEATNALLRDGARLVLGVEDVLDEIGIRPARGMDAAGRDANPAVDGGRARARVGAEPAAGSCAPARGAVSRGAGAPNGRLLGALSEEPAHVDALARGSGLETGAALAALLSRAGGRRAPAARAALRAGAAAGWRPGRDGAHAARRDGAPAAGSWRARWRQWRPQPGRRAGV